MVSGIKPATQANELLHTGEGFYRDGATAGTLASGWGALNRAVNTDTSRFITMP